MRRDDMEACRIRGAGVLLPVSALPSPYGIGTLGNAAYRFIDQLHAAGQTYWQVLPIGPTGFGNSPYQSYSAFAGNPYFIDLDRLAEQGLLTQNDILKFDWGENRSCISYDKIAEHRLQLLQTAYENSNHLYRSDYMEFCKKQEHWLDDYALFMACKDHFGQCEWLKWNPDIKARDSSALMNYRILLKEKIQFWKFCQYQFYQQWNDVKTYANEKGIYIIGDIPIYLALDSSDVWTHPELFLLDDEKQPKAVAGVPPDAFSDTGQLWGNPLYDWDYMEHTGFQWWKYRMACCSELYDFTRIDHFIGIVRYYEIPAGEENAIKGQWRKGPGAKLLHAIHEVIEPHRMIAEDLGVLTDEVTSLRKQMGYPGMKVLQFGFDGNPKNEHLPHNYEKDTVAYSGTHDNETVLGYFSAREEERKRACFYCNSTDLEELPNAFMRMLYGSVADIAILQMQDILSLPNTARMNFPSTIGDNWQWRLESEQFTDNIAERMRQLAHIYGR